MVTAGRSPKGLFEMNSKGLPLLVMKAEDVTKLPGGLPFGRVR